MAGIAGAPHHRDRDGAHRGDVGDRTAGDEPEAGRAQHRGLGGAAGGGPDQPRHQPGEHETDPEAVEQGAEEDKGADGHHGDMEQARQEPIGVERQVDDEAPGADRTGGECLRQVGTDHQGHEYQREQQCRQEEPGAAAHGLEHAHDHDNAQCHRVRRGCGKLALEGLVVERHPGERREHEGGDGEIAELGRDTSRRRRRCDKGECHGKAGGQRQILLGIEGNAEATPEIEHPGDEGGEEHGLQQAAEQARRSPRPLVHWHRPQRLAQATTAG